MRKRLITVRANSHGDKPWVLSLICTPFHLQPLHLGPLGSLDSLSPLAFSKLTPRGISIQAPFPGKGPFGFRNPFERFSLLQPLAQGFRWLPGLGAPPVLLPHGRGGAMRLRTPPSRASHQAPGLHTFLFSHECYQQRGDFSPP